jgi:hypothetical protein
MTLHQSSNFFSAILVLEASAFLASCAPRPPASALPANPLVPGQSAYRQPPPLPSPPQRGHPQALAPPPAVNGQTTISGTVRSFNYGPGGEGLRYARGEIDRNRYLQMLDDLKRK